MGWRKKERKALSALDKAKVIAASVRPYLRHSEDAEFVAGEILRGLSIAGFGWVDPYAEPEPRVYTDDDFQVWSDH